MKHISESIIGRKGSVFSQSREIFKDLSSVYVVVPLDGRDAGMILDTLDPGNEHGPLIDDVQLEDGEIVFVGCGRDFRKLHLKRAIQCDIFWTLNGYKDSVILAILYNIHRIADFDSPNSSTVFRRTYLGKIQF